MSWGEPKPDMSVQAVPQLEFECPLAAGLHARPASHLAEIAKRFTAACWLTNLRTSSEADLKSVLSIVAADVRQGDSCLLRVEGADQSAAIETLRSFLEDRLPGIDEPLTAASSEDAKLPRALAAAGVQPLTGTAAGPGIGRGAAIVIGRIELTPDLAAAAGPAAGRAQELERFQRGLRGLQSRIEDRVTLGSGAEASILQAHLAILEDAALVREVASGIEKGRSAAEAIVEAGRHFAGMLERAGSAYVRERAIDVRELCARLVEEIAGQPMALQAAPTLDGPSILIAETLAPQQLLGVDRRHVAGIVLETAGATSHAVILARSMGIPVVTGVAGATRRLASEAIVDGNRGLVFSAPFADAVARFYEREKALHIRRRAQLAEHAAAPVHTADGVRFEIGANISSAAEVPEAIARGAEGVGVFRIELLFARQSTPLTEDDQFEAYAAAARAAAGRPVIIRTADIGGDKPLPYLNLPAERNPFLGYRGIRIYREHRDWFQTQLRAALRASAEGNIWIMAPMVATFEEALWFRAEAEHAKEALHSAGTPFNDRTPIGIMIEVPSAAMQMERLAAAVDFFSIGSNDLAQYFYAADRENPTVSCIANPRGPAFLALLSSIVKHARAAGKWVGLCGEMGSDPRNLPLLIGLGLNEISVSAAIPELKSAASRLSAAECWELTGRAIGCATAAEVEALLDGAFADPPEPLLSAALVNLASDARSKDEAIRELVEVLADDGRVHDADRLEEAVWAREAVYSTGLGFGFAVPHCRNAAVKADSVAIVRFQGGIEWGSLDGAPVRMAILLALREGDHDKTHMKIFSKLARKLMDEEFRSRLIQIEDAGEVVACLKQELEA